MELLSVSVTQTPGQHYVNVSISALGQIRTNICCSYERCGISPKQYHATLTLPNFDFTQLFKLTNITMSMLQRVVHILAVAYHMHAQSGSYGSLLLPCNKTI